jgi:hypothetical protein
MAGTLNVTTISGASTINGVSTLNAASGILATQNGMTGIAKAWVNFIGSSGTTRSSFNVSSVTRNGAGDYTVNFTTAFSDVNYTPVAMGMRDSDGNGSLNTTVRGNATYANSFTTTTLRVLAENDSGTRVDPTYYGVVCFAS